MNNIIIDSNIAFSAFLNINSRIGQILINGHHYYNFFAPEYLRHEIFGHKEKIIAFSRLTENEFLELYELIIRNVTVLNHALIPVKIYRKALILCNSIDINDAVFIAFAEYIKG
jgi:predicted nucleic acid-binding protein